MESPPLWLKRVRISVLSLAGLALALDTCAVGAAGAGLQQNFEVWLVDHAHGTVATRGERYVWMFDRAGNVAKMFDGVSGARIKTVNLVSAASHDPTPDLGVLSPDGSRIFATMRGPVPLSGDPHATTGSTPGLAVIQLTAGGSDGSMKSIVRISNIDPAGVERADAHGIALRIVR